MTEKSLTEAEDISKIAFGFMASKALFVALHLDLFTQLSESPATADELADRIEIPVNRVLTVLTALTTTGLVEKHLDVFQNSPAAESFLVRGARYDFGDYLRFQIDRQMFPFMGQLEDVVLGRLDNVPVDSYETWMEDAAEARLYSESQHAGSLGPGRSLARMLDLSDANHLLDVAGGTGGFAIRLCEANPQLNVTVLDFPNVVSLGEQKVEEAGLADRIKFLGGNALETAWPEPADAVLMSYLLSGVPEDAIPSLVENARKVLKPGGTFIVHDFMVDDNRSGPELAALWQLQHLAFTPDATSLTPGYVADMMEAKGFEDATVDTLIAGMTRVVWAKAA